MTHVVTSPCIGSVDLSCIEVCPVDCIYAVGEDPNQPDTPLMVIIDPDECIDCGKCVPECPIEAITLDSMLPSDQEPWIAVNALHTGRGDNSGPAEEDAPAKEDIATAAKELAGKVGAGQ